MFFNYLLLRLLQFIMIIFLGITLIFIFVRLMPADPVERAIDQMTSMGSYIDPSVLEDMIDSLKELYGLKGSLISQYFNMWKRLVNGDFGPSLSQFPTPVSKIIIVSVPWTLGLLVTVILISWITGNILGGIAGYYRNKKKILVNSLETLSMILRPIPYYIFALIILVVFSYLLPIFPSSGAFTIGVKVGWNWDFIIDVIKHSILPAISLIVLQMAGWYQSMRLLTSNVLKEDFVVYARYGGLIDRKILYDYVVRNALLPQLTGLALSLGRIFGGALVTEMVFSYPGIGGLLYSAILSGDYNLIIGIVSLSVIGVAAGTLVLDILYPFFDPRIRYR